MSAEAVEALLSDARAARRGGRPDEVLALLDRAWEQAQGLGEEHPLPVVVAWKRAKAVADFGDRASVASCLAPVLEREDLFDAYPHGIFGVGRLCRAHQDVLGYGDPTVRRLWERLAAHHRASGDLFLAALTDLELAWEAACRGDDVRGPLERVEALRPDALEGSRSWHPDAPDGPGSIPFLHVAAAHTLLRAAVWSGDADEVGPAAAELVQAQAETGVPPRPHVQHALLEARHHGLGGLDIPKSPQAQGFDEAFIAALERGAGFVALASEAPGPEWSLAALWCAVRIGEASAEHVVGEARRVGCLAFVQAATRSERTAR